MTSATGRLEGAVLPRAALAPTFNEAPPLFLPRPLRRAAVLVRDLMGAVAVVLCVPFVILAIGTPITLCVRTVVVGRRIALTRVRDRDLE
jgi:hypothetical protein